MLELWVLRDDFMTGLAWANIKHRKLRSVLARWRWRLSGDAGDDAGNVAWDAEVAQRVKGIDAELIVAVAKFVDFSKEPLSDKYIEKSRR